MADNKTAETKDKKDKKEPAKLKPFELVYRKKPMSRWQNKGYFDTLKAAERALMLAGDPPHTTGEYKARPTMVPGVMQYGLRRPSKQDAALVGDQIYLAHRYKNAMAEASRNARNERRAEELRVPEIRKAAKVVATKLAVKQEAEAVIKATRKKTRSRSETPEMKEALKAARVELKAAEEALKAAKQAAWKTNTRLQRAGTRIDKQRHAASLSLRKEFAIDVGISRGTYAWAEKAATAAASGKFDPRCHPFLGDGEIAQQCSGGMPIDQIWSTHPTPCQMIQIDPVNLRVDPNDPTRWATDGNQAKRGDRKRLCRTLVRFRVNTDENRKPVWVTFPTALHRPLPADAVLKWATVYRHRVGTGTSMDRFSLQLTIERPFRYREKRDGVVGVHVGWQAIETAEGLKKLRVATWVGDDGRTGEVVLPERVWAISDDGDVGQLAKARELRSLNDKLFDAARDELLSWMRQRRAKGQYLPKWLKEMAVNAHTWRRHSHLARVVLHWRDHRFKGDEAIFAKLEGGPVVNRKPKMIRTRLDKRGNPKRVPKYMYTSWRPQDKHLMIWEAAARAKGYATRRDWYRTAAKQLATEYGTVVVARHDYAQLQRNDDLADEDDEKKNEHVKTRRNMAAPGTFVGVVKNACGTHGAVFIETVPERSICHVCGTRNKVETVSHEFVCKGCASLVNVGRNIAVNAIRKVLPVKLDVSAKTRAGDPRKAVRRFAPTKPRRMATAAP